jgi:cholesterol oxidase
VNPLWSEGRTPITVHAQGGCAMSDDPGSVTDPNGEVRGAPGVFVMDASLFPSPVGVNPSATILAVAERNLERFIRAEVPGRESWRAVAPEPHPAGPTAREVVVDLAPAALHTREPSPPAKFQPIGIRFRERLFGFHVASQRFPIARYSRFEEAYLLGRQAGQTLSLEIQVTIGDLMAFLEKPADHAARASGELVLGQAGATDAAGASEPSPLPSLPRGRYEVSGEVVMMLDIMRRDQKVFLYRLRFQHEGRNYRLFGHKRLRDDPGKDTWKDTTALFCVLEQVGTSELTAGVIRVALDEFLFKEVRSFEVTGIDEARNPARVLWALASFGEFFFAGLWSVYMREAGWAHQLFTRSLRLGEFTWIPPKKKKSR